MPSPHDHPFLAAWGSGCCGGQRVEHDFLPTPTAYRFLVCREDAPSRRVRASTPTTESREFSRLSGCARASPCSCKRSSTTCTDTPRNQTSWFCDVSHSAWRDVIFSLPRRTNGV